MRSLKSFALFTVAAALAVLTGFSPLLGGEKKYGFDKPAPTKAPDEKAYAYKTFYQNGPDSRLEFSSSVSDEVVYLDAKQGAGGISLEGGIYTLLPPPKKEKSPPAQPEKASGGTAGAGKCISCHGGGGGGGPGGGGGGGGGPGGGGSGGAGPGGNPDGDSAGRTGGDSSDSSSGAGSTGTGRGGSLPPTADPGREGAVCPILIKEVDKIDLTRFRETVDEFTFPCGAGTSYFRIRLNIPGQRKDPAWVVVVVTPPEKAGDRLYLEWRVLQGKAPKKR